MNKRKCNAKQIKIAYKRKTNHQLKMESDVAYKTTLLLIYHLNVMLHSCGCSLLIFLYNHGNKTIQQLILINLSFIEFCHNVLIITLAFLLYSENETSLFISRIVLVFVNTTALFLYYMSMYFLTLDRLLAVCLNLKYPIYCTTAKVKSLLIATWLLGVAMGICCSTLSYYDIPPFDYEPYDIYVYLTLSTGFIILAVATYGILFCKYKKSIQMHTRNSKEGSRDTPPNTFALFFQSNFYISIILIEFYNFPHNS